MLSLEPVKACERLSAALANRAPDLTPELLAAQLAGWEFFDVCGAVVMRKGNELHAAAPADVRGRWITRAGIRAVLADTIARFGSIATSVMRGNEADHRFVQRLGFTPIPGGGDVTRYSLTELRHA